MISAGQASKLYTLAQSVSADDCIVEVGSYRGRSSIALALGTMSGHAAPVFAVDPHEEFIGVLGGRYGWRDREQFMRNVVKARCAAAIRLVNLPSTVAATGWHRPIGLLHLDGDHTLAGVSADLEAWLPHLKPDALVAFDDATDEELGPYQLIHNELISRGWEIGDAIDKMVVMKQPAG